MVGDIDQKDILGCILRKHGDVYTNEVASSNIDGAIFSHVYLLRDQLIAPHLIFACYMADVCGLGKVL